MSDVGLPELRAIRSKKAEHICSKPNVIGTALGLKRTDGEIRDQSSLIVIVDKKCPRSSLSDSENIPVRVRSGDQFVPTDVIELPYLRLEYGPAPFATSDDRKKGTVGAFARDEGDYYALTCAHCIRGADGDPYTPSAVKFWSRTRRRYESVGLSTRAQAWPGSGRPGSFGFSDAALIRLEKREALQWAARRQPLSIWRSLRAGIQVQGETYGGTKTGKILGLDVIVKRRRADMMIAMAKDGTKPGDSGMMWRTANGVAVGLHAMGNGRGRNPSTISLAMAAYRLPKELGVSLRDID